MKKVYIAGPMTGYENFNFDAFYAAEAKLTGMGFYALNPAKLDRSFEGWDKYPPEGFVPSRADYIRFMDRDLNALQGCDFIYMLKGWEKSKGANVKFTYAIFIGLEVIYEEEIHG